MAEGKKVLLFRFPSFGRMLAPAIESVWAARTPARRRGEPVPTHGAGGAVQRDTGPGSAFGRAGGTGITLTRASVVIHIDRWWNPAVEDGRRTVPIASVRAGRRCV